MATALFTLEDYKTYASINSPSQDEQIELLIPAVASAVQTFLGYELEELPLSDPNQFSFVTDVELGKTVVQLTSPYQQDYLLDNFDTSVTKVKLELVTAPGSSISSPNTAEELDPSEWFADPTLGKLTILRPIGQRYRMHVTYDYDTIAAGKDIVLAGMMLLDYWRDKKNFNKTVVSQGQSTTKIAMSNLPKHIESILNMYRIL